VGVGGEEGGRIEDDVGGAGRAKSQKHRGSKRGRADVRAR
jgi:hypothetical protein